jgi:hypothetical protein
MKNVTQCIKYYDHLKGFLDSELLQHPELRYAHFLSLRTSQHPFYI